MVSSPDEMAHSVVKLILQRFTRQLGRTLFFWVVIPILILVVFNLLALLAAYIECRVLGENSAFWNRIPGPGKMDCGKP